MNDRQRLESIVAIVCKYLPPDGISREEAMSQIIELVDLLPEQAEQWDTTDMAHRSGGLSVEQAEKQEHKPWCDYLNIMLTSLPPHKAKCNCKQAEKQEKLCKYCGGIGRVVCDGKCMPEQEPVTWVETNDMVCALLRQAHDVLACASYPFKRPWVGLTDEELVMYSKQFNGISLVSEIEALLKERNNG